MAKVKRKSTKSKKSARAIKVSRRRNKQIISLLLIAIGAIYIYTSKNNAAVELPKLPDPIAYAKALTNEAQPSQNPATETPSPTTIASGDLDEFFLKTDGALELPYFERSEFIVKNAEGRYRLYYDTARRSAQWVAYILTKKDVDTPSVGRSSSFKSDPEVLSRSWPSATSDDYTNTGYDRGHLLPSADRDDSRIENNSTFYLSNVAPQKPNLNRRGWKSLEDQTRRWAQRYDSLYIITGTICSDSPKEISGGVDIPDSFYKAIMVKVGNKWHTQAFLMPNNDGVSKDYNLYRLSVDELEAKTGLDLFCNMSDSIESEIEATSNDNIFKK